MTEEFTKQRVAQSKGPTLSFHGRLLCSTEHRARGADVAVILVLWETPEHNWIALTAFEREGDETRDSATATVIERQDDEQTMRWAAMAAWEWSYHARSMVKSQLRWVLSVTVP